MLAAMLELKEEEEKEEFSFESIGSKNLEKKYTLLSSLRPIQALEQNPPVHIPQSYTASHHRSHFVDFQ